MSAPNFSEVVAEKLTRLKVLEQSPSSPTRDQELLAVKGELLELHKLVCDKMNALPWNEEKKQLQGLREQLDRAPIWGYEIDVDVSTKRLNELDTELSAGGLNDSKRRKLHKERQTILALRRRLVEEVNATRPPVTKSVTEKIAEYEARRARFLGSEKTQS
jgi:hypothetical protein